LHALAYHPKLIALLNQLFGRRNGKKEWQKSVEKMVSQTFF
jgi:hypothetical protein